MTTANPPVVTKSGQLDHATGIVSGPVVDSTAGKVYVFSSSDGTTACTGAVPCSAVYMLATNFASGNAGTKGIVGSSRVAPLPNPMYIGGFDSTYRASVNATGNLYVCGNTGGAPTIYQVPITAGVIGTDITGGPLSGSTTKCSPVTDVSNPNSAGGISELIYASVQTNGLGNNCAGGGTGCMMNFLVQPWLPSHAYTCRPANPRYQPSRSSRQSWPERRNRSSGPPQLERHHRWRHQRRPDSALDQSGPACRGTPGLDCKPCISRRLPDSRHQQ